MAFLIFIISYIIYITLFTMRTSVYLVALYLVLALPLAFITLVMVYLLHMPLILILPSNHPYKAYLMRSMAYFLNHFVFRMDVKLIGAEHVPKEGPLIIYANHKSYTDAFAMLEHFPRPLTLTPKKSVMKIPILRTWLKGYKVFPINRKSARETAKDLEDAINTVKSGHAMIIYPEGGIKNRLAQSVEQMKPGAFKLAIKSEATILVARYDGNDLIRKRAPFKKSIRVLTLFEPITYEAYKEMSTTEIAQMVMRIINSKEKA